jgi:hypothetical protein
MTETAMTQFPIFSRFPSPPAPVPRVPPASYHDDDIPLFPAIYSGIAKTFGCSFHDKDIERDGGAVFAHKMGR